MKYFALFTTALLLLVGGCADIDALRIDRESNEPVKIGVILPLSGRYQRFGESNRRGVELAADELNSR
ncbi:MAG: hypothetical protein PHI35_04985, partial [Victivallaceae bacterium]|nr:hypothetical protein [Victivallaceae bacterium]